ncbi:MAG TPA: MOSC N-terminal beta barrel domain-containing protein [Solirubrobacteraceae bacterium]|nr:MOSC N-terminal beta barrel domain-containing protein [Solirubrobacteraceae bacterium]
MSATVTQLSIAPVKGMRLVNVDDLDLGASGARGDRAFCVVDTESRQLLTTRTPGLMRIAPRWEDGALALRFPDGSEVAEPPALGERARTANYEGRPIHGRLVGGALAEAVSAHLGRPVRLLARDEGERLADDAPVTLMSDASLAALAPALDGRVPDARRFRMTLAIGGVRAWQEHGWAGREIAVGEALLRGLDPVPRCVVTTRDPDDGRTDAPVLAALAQLRGKGDVTFGIWCEVLQAGRVRVGDPVATA